MNAEDLDPDLRALDRVPVPDQWDEIRLGSTRSSGNEPRRISRVLAAAVVATLFVAAVAWAGLIVRTHHANVAGWRLYGSRASTTWTIRYPSSWGVQTTTPCPNAPKVGGAIFSNTTFTFRDPEGHPAGCGDRYVLEGFPRDGVAVAIEPAAVIAGLFFPTPPTPFPIRMAQLVSTGGIRGGPSERDLGIQLGSHSPLGSGSPFTLRVWIGPEASAQERADVSRVVASLGAPYATTWVTSRVAENEGVRISLPSDWHVHSDGAGLQITTYAPRTSPSHCAVPAPNEFGGMRYASAMIWIPRSGSSFAEPQSTGSPPIWGVVHKVEPCMRNWSPAAWRYVTVWAVPPVGPPIGVRAVIVYGDNAAREDTASLLRIVIDRMALGSALGQG